MDTDTCGPFQATPHETLMLELLDCRVPKSEREHAAAREIVTLRAELLATQDQANGQAEVSEDYGRQLREAEAERDSHAQWADYYRARWLGETAVPKPDLPRAAIAAKEGE